MKLIPVLLPVDEAGVGVATGAGELPAIIASRLFK
jgi:hypothetical protein